MAPRSMPDLTLVRRALRGFVAALATFVPVAAQSWSQVAPGFMPAPRSNSPMAHDVFRGIDVLFGGYGSSGPLGDTWEWDGSV